MKQNHSNPTVAVLPGDGIGPEVMHQAIRVLNAVAPHIQTQEGLIGGAAYAAHGQHFPEVTASLVKQSDAVLFGSVGGPIALSEEPQWKHCEVNSILALRKLLNFDLNIRPAIFYPGLADLSPLKNARLPKHRDVTIIRELAGDIYFGEKRFFEQGGEPHAEDVASYTKSQIQRVAEQAFAMAQAEKRKLCSVDKANVLHTSKLWRRVFDETSRDFPDVPFEHMLVDNCAMQLILNPGQFELIATSNLFGDILSDAASALPGSLGMMPSASFNAAGFGLYEPSGGSAPELANQNVANPMAQILSMVLMLRHSFGLDSQANAVAHAVEATLNAGFRTQDIQQKGCETVGTHEFTTQILHQLERVANSDRSRPTGTDG